MKWQKLALAIVEPLNPAIRENAMLTTTDETMDLLNEIGHPNLGLEYDAFHMHVTEGNMAETVQSICHISATYKLQMSQADTNPEQEASNMMHSLVHSTRWDIPIGSPVSTLQLDLRSTDSTGYGSG